MQSAQNLTVRPMLKRFPFLHDWIQTGKNSLPVKVFSQPITEVVKSPIEFEL